VRHASGFVLRVVRSRISSCVGHARPGPRATNSFLRQSCVDESKTARASHALLRRPLKPAEAAGIPERGIPAGARYEEDRVIKVKIGGLKNG